MARNEQAYELAHQWIKWLDTRRFYGTPEQKNILAILIGGDASTGNEPNADIQPQMVAFNLAVMDMPIDRFVPFVAVYCDYRPQPIKVMAHDMGICKTVFYANADKAASRAVSVTRQLVTLNLQMRREIEASAFSRTK